MGDISTFLDNKRVPLKEDDRKQMKGKYPYYGASGIIDYIDDYIFDEELILMGEDGANIVTRSSKLIFLAKGKYWVNNHAHVIKANSDINQYFLSESLERINYEKYNTGTAQPKLNRDVCQKIKVKIPEYSEQNKIASFLVQIDQKIKLLEQKYKNYKNFKKYLMQQIFAQKLRFDFKDEWKQYKLKELLTVKSSSISINQLEDNFGEYPLYGASGFLKNIDFCEMETDYISIVKDGSGVGNLSYHEKNSSIVNTSQYLLPKKGFDIHFLYYQLQTLNLLKYVNGSSIPHIYFKDYGIEKVNVPSLSEQQQIGRLFVNTDKSLENINNSIQVTQEFKKGLLQQMFVYFRIKFLISVRKSVASDIF